MNAEESGNAYRERIDKMSKPELDQEMIRLINIIRVDAGMPEVTSIDEVHKILQTPLPEPPKHQSVEKMNFWQRMKYGLVF